MPQDRLDLADVGTHGRELLRKRVLELMRMQLQSLADDVPHGLGGERLEAEGGDLLQPAAGQEVAQDQLVTALSSHGRGHWFESRIAHHTAPL